MAYYVDAGTNLEEVDDVAEGERILWAALDNAKAFKDAQGYWPYWAKECEMRKGRQVPHDWNRAGNEARNQKIIDATKPMTTWARKRDAFIANN